MSGRGKEWTPSTVDYDKVSVIIGLRLSCSPPSLPASTDAPFYLVLQARLLKSPHPDQHVTFAAYNNLFHGLHRKSFTNIVLVDPDLPDIPVNPCIPTLINPAGSFRESCYNHTTCLHHGVIELWPAPHYFDRLSNPDLRKDYKFLTVPSMDHGGYLTCMFRVSDTAIAAACVEPGQKYVVSLTDFFCAPSGGGTASSPASG